MRQFKRIISGRAGFTLLEVTIVIAIMAVLSGVLLGYNRRSEGQIALYASQSKLVGFLNRAKAAALEKREKGLAGKTVCAFGVRLRSLKASDPMILFADSPIDPLKGCAVGNFNRSYDGASESVEQLPLDSGIEITEYRNGQSGIVVSGPIDIVFEPPYLVTYNYGIIKLGITGRNIFACVEVNSGGAVFSRNCP